MGELIKEFLLFGIVENMVLICWFKWICRLDKVKYWHVFIFGISWGVIGIIKTPYGRQVLECIFLIIYLTILNNKYKKKYIAYVFSSIMILLISESVLCIPLDILKIVDFSSNKTILYKSIILNICHIGAIISMKLWRIKWEEFGGEKSKN